MPLSYFDYIYPGWYEIAYRAIQKIKVLDPECDIYVKEKFGLLRIRVYSTTHHRSEFREIENAAELESSTTCEFCGQPGRLRSDRSYLHTLCDRCHSADNRQQIIDETEKKWKAVYLLKEKEK